MHTPAAQLGHDLLSRQLRRVLFDLVFLGQRLAHLPEVPASTRVKVRKASSPRTSMRSKLRGVVPAGIRSCPP